jgi:hypothetical protein
MTLSIPQLVEKIHDTGPRVVIVSSGGGASGIADLLAVPGASRTVLEATVPYSEGAMLAWLGGRVDQFCSSRTARSMAVVAWQRARRFAAEPTDKNGSELFFAENSSDPFVHEVAGVAVTASLATDRPKRGTHRVHAAVQTLERTAWASLEFDKETRTRDIEEEIVRRLLLNLVADACGLPERLDLPLVAGEKLQRGETSAPTAWQELMIGRVESVRQGGTDEHVAAIFPGAFHPLHDGHRQMAVVAEKELGLPVAMELSIANPDKPPLDYVEIHERTAQFPQERAVWLTRAATFEAKSRIFPGAWFIVGIDTLERLVSPRYYGGDPAACRKVLEAIAARGCHFLVFGRDLGSGFRRLADVAMPAELLPLCREITPEQFRADISSTALRTANAEVGRRLA